MFSRAKLVYAAGVAVMVIAFAVSFVGQSTDGAGNPVNTSHSGNTTLYWIGAAGWFTFGIAILALALFTVALAGRTVVRRTRTKVAQSAAS